MSLQDKLNAMRAWTAARLSARCPVKPIRPPARFDFKRKWPMHLPGPNGQTVAQFCAIDAYAEILGANALARERFSKTLGKAKTVAEYVAAWDQVRGLLPGAMTILYPTAEGCGEGPEERLAA